MFKKVAKVADIQIQSPGMESIHCRKKLDMSKDSCFIEIFLNVLTDNPWLLKCTQTAKAAKIQYKYKHNLLEWKAFIVEKNWI